MYLGRGPQCDNAHELLACMPAMNQAIESTRPEDSTKIEFVKEAAPGRSGSCWAAIDFGAFLFAFQPRTKQWTHENWVVVRRTLVVRGCQHWKWLHKNQWWVNLHRSALLLRQIGIARKRYTRTASVVLPRRKTSVSCKVQNQANEVKSWSVGRVKPQRRH